MYSLSWPFSAHQEPASNCPDIVKAWVKAAPLKCLLIIISAGPDVHNLDSFSQSFRPGTVFKIMFRGDDGDDSDADMCHLTPESWCHVTDVTSCQPVSRARRRFTLQLLAGPEQPLRSAHNNCSFAAALQIETWINSTNIQFSAKLCAQCFTFCLIFVPMPVYLFAKFRIHFITLNFIFNLRKHLILLFLILRKCKFFKLKEICIKVAKSKINMQFEINMMILTHLDKRL